MTAPAVHAVVALGSNLGRRRDTILSGVAEMARLPGTRLLATSRLRPTEPVGAPPGSPAFINGACRLATTLDARGLLEALLDIERRHGRRRAAPNAPRTLDLDLILFGGQVLDEPGLSVPHPRAHLRAFVLEPAAEVAGELVHPRLGATLAELRDALAAARAAPSGDDPGRRAAAPET